MVKVVVFLAAAAGALNFGAKPTTAGTTPAAFKPAFGNPAAIAQTMHDFDKQSQLMGAKEEMMDDAMDALDGEWGDDDDEVLAQVMDEIGFEQTAAMQSAPSRAVAAAAGGGSSTGAAGQRVGGQTQSMQAI